jgi:hypothetical protein
MVDSIAFKLGHTLSILFVEAFTPCTLQSELILHVAWFLVGAMFNKMIIFVCGKAWT